ncbi:MAG: hypothetical protein QM703_25180 [Gemmatales bacterium]
MTHQITLDITDEELKALETESQATGKPIRAIVQESYLEGRNQRKAYGHFKRFAGFFQSGVSDLARNHDEYLGKAANDLHRK